MSDEKEKELKKMEETLSALNKEISEILNQLATSEEELDREYRSKQLEEKRLEDKRHEVARLEHKREKLQSMMENLNQKIKELNHQLHFKN